MTQKVSSKIAVDRSLVFPLVEHLNAAGFGLGHVRFLPWRPKLEGVLEILERLWRTHSAENIRGFETRTDGGFKVIYFVAYSIKPDGIKVMKIVEAWIESLVNGGELVFVGNSPVSLEALVLKSVTVFPSP